MPPLFQEFRSAIERKRERITIETKNPRNESKERTGGRKYRLKVSLAWSRKPRIAVNIPWRKQGSP